MDQPYSAWADRLNKFHTSSEWIQVLWLVAGLGDGFGRDVVGDAGFVRDCGTFTPGGVGADRSRLPRQARALGGLQVRARTEGGGLGQPAPGADQAG